MSMTFHTIFFWVGSIFSWRPEHHRDWRLSQVLCQISKWRTGNMTDNLFFFLKTAKKNITVHHWWSFSQLVLFSFISISQLLANLKHHFQQKSGLKTAEIWHLRKTGYLYISYTILRRVFSTKFGKIGKIAPEV